MEALRSRPPASGRSALSANRPVRLPGGDPGDSGHLRDGRTGLGKLPTPVAERAGDTGHHAAAGGKGQFAPGSVQSIPARFEAKFWIPPIEATWAGVGATSPGNVTTTFTGVMLTITSGSFVVPLTVAGGFCLLGAAIYLFMVGEIAPLPPLTRDVVGRTSTAG